MLQPEKPFDFVEERAHLEKNGCYSYDPSRSIAYTRRILKTAALLYDRIYLDWFDYQTLRYVRSEQMPVDALFLDERLTAGVARYLDLGSGIIPKPQDPKQEQEALTYGILELSKEYKLNITPIYGSEWPKQHSFASPQGDDVRITETLELAMTAFPAINEEVLTWQLVDEFRSDINAIGGLRRIRFLLSEVSKCRSPVECSDLIGQRIETYKRACRKHGVQLLSSTLEQVVRKDTLIAAFGAGAATGSLSSGVTLGTIKIAADMTINLINSIRERQALSSEHSTAAAAVVLKMLETRIKQAS